MEEDGIDRIIVRDRIYTLEEVASLLAISRRTVYKYATDGQLRARKLGGLWRITGAAILKFVNGGARTSKGIPHRSRRTISKTKEPMRPRKGRPKTAVAARMEAEAGRDGGEGIGHPEPTSKSLTGHPTPAPSDNIPHAGMEGQTVTKAETEGAESLSPRAESETETKAARLLREKRIVLPPGVTLDQLNGEPETWPTHSEIVARYPRRKGEKQTFFWWLGETRGGYLSEFPPEYTGQKVDERKTSGGAAPTSEKEH